MDGKKAKRNQQNMVLERHKMRPMFWAVVRDLDTVLVCKNRITGEFRCISK